MRHLATSQDGDDETDDAIDQKSSEENVWEKGITVVLLDLS